MKHVKSIMERLFLSQSGAGAGFIQYEGLDAYCPEVNVMANLNNHHF